MRLTAIFCTAFMLLTAMSSLSAATSDSLRVTSLALTEHMYLLTSIAEHEANQVASVGPDGILLVDVGWTQTAPKLKEALTAFGQGPVRLIINTHGHGDHASGNRLFRNESIIVAQRNVPDRLGNRYFALPPMESQDTPMLLVDDSLRLRFNGEEVQLVHWPNAHSDGDLIVHFTGSHIVCVGDFAFPDHFPYIDVNGGGDVANYLADVKRLADVFPPESRFIAGHGRVLTHSDLLHYYGQLLKQKETVRQALSKGVSVADIQKDSVLAEWNAWSGPWVTTDANYWIASLAGALSPSAAPKLSISSPVSEVLVRDGITAAVKRYYELKATQPTPYEFGERELNLLGYNLLWRQRLNDAIAIFKLGVEEYPMSFNVYDSYGEALLAQGDTLAAATNYKKSLELNPENTNAANILKQLGTK